MSVSHNCNEDNKKECIYISDFPYVLMVKNPPSNASGFNPRQKTKIPLAVGQQPRSHNTEPATLEPMFAREEQFIAELEKAQPPQLRPSAAQKEKKKLKDKN